MKAIPHLALRHPRHPRHLRRGRRAGAGVALTLAASLVAPCVPSIARARDGDAAARTTAPPRHVVSINLCADQMLLELAAPGQILSLSRLALDPAASHHLERARGLPTNDGTAEPVVALDPDLVIVGEFSDRYTVRLLEARGLDIRTLPLADSVQGVLDNLLLVGGWLGREVEARTLVDSLEARLAAIAAADADEVEDEDGGGDGRPGAAVYDPNGYTVGPESLRGEMIARAGFRNVAEEAGITGYGSLSIETLLRHAPDVLIDSPFSPGTWSRAQALALHPALRERGLDPTVVTFASADTICGGAWSIDLIERLVRERHALERAS